MTAATIGNWQFELGTDASPQVLTAIEEVKDVSGLGVSNELLDVTNFDSPSSSKEYIAGLADGSEITVECNYVPNATLQDAAMQAADDQASRLARLRYTGASPEKTWSFTAVCLGYEVNPSVNDANALTFTYKISGNITRA